MLTNQKSDHLEQRDTIQYPPIKRQTTNTTLEDRVRMTLDEKKSTAQHRNMNDDDDSSDTPSNYVNFSHPNASNINPTNYPHANSAPQYPYSSPLNSYPPNPYVIQQGQIYQHNMQAPYVSPGMTSLPSHTAHAAPKPPIIIGHPPSYGSQGNIFLLSRAAPAPSIKIGLPPSDAIHSLLDTLERQLTSACPNFLSQNANMQITDEDMNKIIARLKKIQEEHKNRLRAPGIDLNHRILFILNLINIERVNNEATQKNQGTNQTFNEAHRIQFNKVKELFDNLYNILEAMQFDITIPPNEISQFIFNVGKLSRTNTLITPKAPINFKFLPIFIQKYLSSIKTDQTSTHTPQKLRQFLIGLKLTGPILVNLDTKPALELGQIFQALTRHTNEENIDNLIIADSLDSLGYLAQRKLLNITDKKYDLVPILSKYKHQYGFNENHYLQLMDIIYNLGLIAEKDIVHTRLIKSSKLIQILEYIQSHYHQIASKPRASSQVIWKVMYGLGLMVSNHSIEYDTQQKWDLIWTCDAVDKFIKVKTQLFPAATYFWGLAVQIERGNLRLDTDASVINMKEIILFLTQLLARPFEDPESFSYFICGLGLIKSASQSRFIIPEIPFEDIITDNSIECDSKTPKLTDIFKNSESNGPIFLRLMQGLSLLIENSYFKSSVNNNSILIFNLFIQSGFKTRFISTYSQHEITKLKHYTEVMNQAKFVLDSNFNTLKANIKRIDSTCISDSDESGSNDVPVLLQDPILKDRIAALFSDKPHQTINAFTFFSCTDEQKDLICSQSAIKANHNDDVDKKENTHNM